MPAVVTDASTSAITVELNVCFVIWRLIRLRLNEVVRQAPSRLSFFYVAALRLMNTAILMGPLFLNLWVQGLRWIG